MWKNIEISKICEAQCYTTWQAKAIAIKSFLISSVLYLRTLTAMGFFVIKRAAWCPSSGFCLKINTTIHCGRAKNFWLCVLSGRSSIMCSNRDPEDFACSLHLSLIVSRMSIWSLQHHSVHSASADVTDHTREIWSLHIRTSAHFIEDFWNTVEMRSSNCDYMTMNWMMTHLKCENTMEIWWISCVCGNLW